VTPAAARQQVRGCVHVLHATGDSGIHRTHQDFLRGRDNRLRTRAADPIYGHGGDLDGQSSVDRRLSCGIHLVAGLHGIAHDDRTDVMRLQARPLNCCVDRNRAKIDGRNVLQRTAECADGGADWFGDHD
jgi:hypothetical protein